MGSRLDIDKFDLSGFASGRLARATLSPPARPVGNQQSRVPQWHPKITISRLFVIGSTLALGPVKAVMSYRGDTVASVTIEWITTIVIFLIFLALSSCECQQNARPAWLFQYDTLELVWNLARRLSLHPPAYETEERPIELVVKPRHPPVTIYRMLVTSIVLGFGMAKATLSYMGETTEPITIEWVSGVVLAICLYILGLYEQSSTRVLPSLFEEDYVNEFLHSGNIFVWVLIYSVGLFITGGWTYLWITQLYLAWFTDGGLVDLSKASSTLEGLLIRSVTILWLPCVIVFAIGLGLWRTPLLLGSLFRLIGPELTTSALHIGSFLHRGLGLPEISSGSRLQGLAQALKRFTAKIKKSLPSTEMPNSLSSLGKPVSAILVYVVVHAFALLLSLGFIALWATILYAYVASFQVLPWYEWGWSALFCISGFLGTIVGIGFTLYVVAAFFNIFFKPRHLLVDGWAL
ncbi:hypothetical protein BKA70DRAFT_1562992 [Coprinopsis sp. MPI-PUGE-AT-0042]|nr:hypothetical protein BKA70DRAFT_1562992 [Coprinopsis sp. MPI-PUGE-AT-0042]